MQGGAEFSTESFFKALLQVSQLHIEYTTKSTMQAYCTSAQCKQHAVTIMVQLKNLNEG
jgi:hypothetical protein